MSTEKNHFIIMANWKHWQYCWTLERNSMRAFEMDSAQDPGPSLRERTFLLPLLWNPGSPFPSALLEFMSMAQGHVGLESYLALWAHWASKLCLRGLGSTPFYKFIHLTSLRGFWTWKSGPLEGDASEDSARLAWSTHHAQVDMQNSLVSEDSQSHQTFPSPITTAIIGRATT